MRRWIISLVLRLFGYGANGYEPEPEVKPPKKGKSLKEVAEEIVKRKMLQEKDTYGIEASEKILKMQKPEAKTLVEQLEEFKRIEKLLGGKGAGEGGLLKTAAEGLGAGAAQVLTPLLQQYIANLEKAQQAQMEQLERAQQIETVVRPQLTAPPAPQQQVSLNDLVALLDKTPEEVVKELPQDWIGFLAKQDYKSLTDLLSQLPDDPQYSEPLAELLSKEREAWVEEVIELAKK